MGGIPGFETFHPLIFPAPEGNGRKMTGKIFLDCHFLVINRPSNCRAFSAFSRRKHERKRGGFGGLGIYFK
jgi:hypothetical protein